MSVADWLGIVVLCEQTSAMLPVPCSVKRKEREGEIFYLKKKKNGRGVLD